MSLIKRALRGNDPLARFFEEEKSIKITGNAACDVGQHVNAAVCVMRDQLEQVAADVPQRENPAGYGD